MAQHIARMYLVTPVHAAPYEIEILVSGRKLSSQRFPSELRLLEHVVYLCEEAAKRIEKGKYNAAERMVSEARGVMIGSGLNVSSDECDRALEIGEYPPKTPR